MYNFPGPNRFASLLSPVLLVIGVVFVLQLAWGFINKDNYDAESITVEFHCPTVLAMKENYPTFVINECKKLHDN
jgi:hypothetical protein